MKLDIFVVDAFCSGPFTGNPAAVCPLDEWLPDELLQAIASENNLSETAFFVRARAGYRIRWFSPTSEIDLCGHATLASAFVVTQRLDPNARLMTFESMSGPLGVAREGELLALDFPARPASACDPHPLLFEGLGREPRAVFAAERDYLAIFDSEAEVRELRPRFDALADLDRQGVCVSAPADSKGSVDFVSRFFAPALGVPEDPVTGSAHCVLVPYWASRLGRSELRAVQASARGGELFCSARGERVRIAGRARLYLEGTIRV